MDIDVEGYYRQYGPMVFRRCRQILRDQEKAKDAMQDVFVLLLKNQHRLQGNYPSSLLYRMATNVCLNIIRSEKRRSETADTELVEIIASVDDIESNAEAKDFINRIFSREKESTRTIAYMHLVDRMTLQEVADAVGMSVSGVRKRLRTLKENVKELEEV